MHGLVIQVCACPWCAHLRTVRVGTSGNSFASTTYMAGKASGWEGERQGGHPQHAFGLRALARLELSRAAIQASPSPVRARRPHQFPVTEHGGNYELAQKPISAVNGHGQL